ncbi:MAG: hypothetical protein AB7E72_18785 [Lysobacterales bacterium]
MNPYKLLQQAGAMLALAMAAGTALADCPMPPNLKEGVHASFFIAAAKDGIVFGKVEKIDRAQCWVRVTSRTSGGENWINLRQVEMVSTAPRAD